jgi:hypothetical protein
MDTHPKKALGLFGQEADDPPANSGSISDPDTVIATDCSTDITESWQHSYYGAPVHSRIGCFYLTCIHENASIQNKIMISGTRETDRQKEENVELHAYFLCKCY